MLLSVAHEPLQVGQPVSATGRNGDQREGESGFEIRLLVFWDPGGRCGINRGRGGKLRGISILIDCLKLWFDDVVDIMEPLFVVDECTFHGIESQAFKILQG